MKQRDAGTPERSCAVCRKKTCREKLIRFVLDGTTREVVCDLLRTLPGRGVNVHPSAGCLGGRSSVNAVRDAFLRAARHKRAAGLNAGGRSAGGRNAERSKKQAERSDANERIVCRKLGELLERAVSELEETLREGLPRKKKDLQALKFGEAALAELEAAGRKDFEENKRTRVRF